MRTKLFLVFVFFLTVLAAQNSLAAGLNDFTGTWMNVDANTGGLTKLVITTSPTPADDPNVSVHAWGQCHPTDCDWGVVKAHAYCPNVSCNIVATADGMMAVYKTGFSEMTLIIRRAGARLVVQTFTHFTDNSNRRNYDATYTFQRKMIPLPLFEAPHEPPAPPKMLGDKQ